jgi:hypothetical protein
LSLAASLAFALDELRLPALAAFFDFLAIDTL